MRRILLIIAILFAFGCTVRITYENPDGTKIVYERPALANVNFGEATIRKNPATGELEVSLKDYSFEQQVTATLQVLAEAAARGTSVP